jgi:hypothetical protein
MVRAIVVLKYIASNIDATGVSHQGGFHSDTREQPTYQPSTEAELDGEHMAKKLYHSSCVRITCESLG